MYCDTETSFMVRHLLVYLGPGLRTRFNVSIKLLVIWLNKPDRQLFLSCSCQRGNSTEIFTLCLCKMSGVDSS